MVSVLRAPVLSPGNESRQVENRESEQRLERDNCSVSKDVLYRGSFHLDIIQSTDVVKYRCEQTNTPALGVF